VIPFIIRTVKSALRWPLISIRNGITSSNIGLMRSRSVSKGIFQLRNPRIFLDIFLLKVSDEKLNATMDVKFSFEKKPEGVSCFFSSSRPSRLFLPFRHYSFHDSRSAFSTYLS